MQLMRKRSVYVHLVSGYPRECTGRYTFTVNLTCCLPGLFSVLQPKEFETKVQVVQRYPEMKTVEKTDFVKEVHHEERVVTVPKTRVIMEEVERVDRVPMVKEVNQTRIETVHRY